MQLSRIFQHNSATRDIGTPSRKAARIFSPSGKIAAGEKNGGVDGCIEESWRRAYRYRSRRRGGDPIRFLVDLVRRANAVATGWKQQNEIHVGPTNAISRRLLSSPRLVLPARLQRRWCIRSRSRGLPGKNLREPVRLFAAREADSTYSTTPSSYVRVAGN